MGAGQYLLRGAQERGAGDEPYFRRTYTFLGTGKSEPSLPRYEEVRRMISRAMVDVLHGQQMDRVLGRLEFDANRTLRGS